MTGSSEPRCSVYIAASVDGFIARADGDISWLHREEYAKGGVPGLGWEEYISNVDALVMGRQTFDKVRTFGTWPYEGTPVVVLSRRGVDIPPELKGSVSVDAGEPRQIVERQHALGRHHLYIDGGATIQAFLADGCLDELIITRIPVLLGGGIPLFGPLDQDIHLQLTGIDAAPNGFVQERYRVG